MIVLPEMWNTGYALEQIGELADEAGERTREVLGAFCEKHRVAMIAGSIAEKTSAGVRNTALIFDKQGKVIADYSKVHLFRLMDEEKHLISGEKDGLFELFDQRFAVSICYDIRFPEWIRKLALAGSKVAFIPAQWPHPRLEHWRTLLRARAIENQMYIIACNRVGNSRGTDFFGHSQVIDPWGEIVIEAGEEETIVRATIDLDLVSQVRSKIPVFEDRREQLY